MLFKRKKSLIISKDLAPVLTQKEADKLCELQETLVQDYLQNRDKMSMDEWLEKTMIRELPDSDPEKLKQDSKLTLETLDIKEQKLEALRNHRKKGLDPAYWLAKEMNEQTKDMSTEDSLKHIHEVAKGVEMANKQVFNQVNMRASLMEQGLDQDQIYDGAQTLAARFNQAAANKQSEYRAEVDYSNISIEQPNGQVHILDKQGQVVDSYDIQYEEIPDSEEEWNKHNVYTNNPIVDAEIEEKIETVSQQIGVDPEKAKKVVASINDSEQLSSNLKDIAVDKVVEIVSDKLGIEQNTVKNVIDIVDAPDPAEKAVQVATEVVVEKASEYVNSKIQASVSEILGPDLTSSGKYVNIPWGSTYGPDIDTAPAGGWTKANIKERVMWINDEISANSTLNLGCGNVVNMVENYWKNKTSNANTSKAVEQLLAKGDLKGLKAASAASIQIGVGKGMFPSIIPKTKSLSVPAMTLMADLAVSKTHDITQVATKALVDRTIGDHIVASTATIGQMAGKKVGTSIGAAIGTVIGPVGTVIGSVVGAGLGWIAGAKIGKAICSTIKTVACKVVDGVKNTVKTVVSGAISAVKAVGSTICSAVGAVARGATSIVGGACRAVGSVFSGICSAVGSFFSGLF